MNCGTQQDREMLNAMPKEKLLDLFFLHIRNLWRVDGLYFLGIEERFGTNAAAQIDAHCWKVMGKIEARALRRICAPGKIDVMSLLNLLRQTSWALDLHCKQVEATPSRGVLRVTKCRTQETRIQKGLGVFPCREVRLGYLESFTEELDSKIEVACVICPPGKRSEGIWCEWEFTLRES